METPITNLIPVLVIELTRNSLSLEIQTSGLDVLRVDFEDKDQITAVIREMPPATRFIIDAQAFQGHGTFTARRCIRVIRAIHRRVAILVIREGRVIESIRNRDLAKRATAVIFTTALTGKRDSQLLNQFIREGRLPDPTGTRKHTQNKTPKSTAPILMLSPVDDGDEPDGEDIPVPDPHDEPPKSTHGKRDFEQKSSPVTTKTIRKGVHAPQRGNDKLAIAKDDPSADTPVLSCDVAAGKKYFSVKLFDHTIPFGRKGSLAECFFHIVNIGSITTPHDIMASNKAGAQVKLSNIRGLLNTIQPRLGECIIPDRGIGAHFNRNIFLRHMSDRKG